MLSYFSSARTRMYALLLFIYLSLSAILRLILWISFGHEESVRFWQFFASLIVGSLNDLIVLVYLSLPITALFLFFSSKRLNGRLAKGLLAVTTFAILFFGFYLGPVEYFFFEEFDSRFNLIAVDYFAYPTEVLGNLWESYPIIWFVVGILLVTYIAFRVIWPQVKLSLQGELRFRSRAFCALLHVFVAIVLLSCIGTETFFISSNRVSNQIASNGISSFFQAVFTQNIDYNTNYNTLPREKAFSLMRDYLSDKGGVLSSDQFSLERTFDAKPEGFGKLNVVVLGQESLGAQFIGAYGDDRGLSPEIDKLAKESLVFKNAYATGTRTVRGLEAMTTSFPPIPSESIVKRSNNENFANIGTILRQNGYQVAFLYGGYGLFDNMNYFFSQNGWEIGDRTDVEHVSFSNIWGVCDEDLFRYSINYFDEMNRKGKPFFSLVMSTSNHKPFSFPKGLPGIPAEKGGRLAGVRYADYAIGRFFEMAKNKEWFDNTLFVVMADHDSRVYGRAEVPVERYRIPVLFYAPKHIKPQVVEKTFSQIDLAPTILGLLGLPYSAPFYGVDVLDPATQVSRPVLLSHNHNVAIYQDERLSVLGLQQQITSYNYRDKATTKLEEIDQPMADLATAYLQTAYELYRDKKYLIKDNSLVALHRDANP